MERWGEEMSEEKAVEYDHTSSVSFVNGLQTACGLMAGFAFTGILVVLTGLGDPSALLSQIALAILDLGMIMFLRALFELHLLNVVTCMRSPKPIIPIFPESLPRWRIINRYLLVGSFLVTISIPVMFLLKNLTVLFVLALCLAILGNVLFYFRSWLPVKKEYYW